MLGKCFAFFEELTIALVASNQPHNKLNAFKKIEEELSSGSIFQDNYLYSDAYKLNIEKLIASQQQEKLKVVYGEEWVKVVNGIYKHIERELHDDTINKFGGLISSKGDTDE